MFLCQYHTVLMTVGLWYNLKSGRLIPPAPFFFLKTALAIRGLWCFRMNCEIFCPAAAAAKSRQSCPTLCNPIDSSPPGSPVPGILQARTLEWVAISFSNAWKWKVKVKSLSCVWLFMTPWTVAYQAPPSMGFSRQEYWSGVPLPSPVFKPSYTDLKFTVWTHNYFCTNPVFLPSSAFETDRTHLCTQ